MSLSSESALRPARAWSPSTLLTPYLTKSSGPEDPMLNCYLHDTTSWADIQVQGGIGADTTYKRVTELQKEVDELSRIIMGGARREEKAKL